MLAELDHRMMPFHTHAGARAEFKSLMPCEKEGLREFSRRVRSLGDVANMNIGAQARDDMNREQFLDRLFDVELQDQLLREDLGSLAQAVARAQALEVVFKTSRARNRKRLHFPRMAENVPEQGAEASRSAGGQNRRLPLVGTNSGRQQAGTDPRIDQLVSVQSDILTQMQNMASMMGRFVNSIIPAPNPENLPRPDQTQRPRQLFDPYPGQDRLSYQNSGVGRYGVESQVPRGSCQKTADHLNYQGPGQ